TSAVEVAAVAAGGPLARARGVRAVARSGRVRRRQPGGLEALAASWACERTGRTGKLTRDKPPCTLPSGQRIEEGFGLLQVSGVKALREPAVGRRQQLAGLSALALLLPQTRQAHGGTQLPGLRLLAAGQDEGLLETGLRLGGVMARGLQEPLPPESIQLRFPPALARGLRGRQRLGPGREPRLDLPLLRVGLRQ